MRTVILMSGLLIAGGITDIAKAIGGKPEKAPHDVVVFIGCVLIACMVLDIIEVFK